MPAQDISYRTLKEDFNKCLKIETIYDSIIKPITKLQLLDLEER
jgi:hypothetical protein